VPAFEAAILEGGAPVRLEGEIQQLNLELMGEGAALEAGRIALSGGAVRAPAYELRLSGIEGEIALAAAGLVPDQAIPVAIDSIVHQGEPAWFAPLRLEGSVQPQGDRIAFDALIAPKAGGVEARLAGGHDRASGEGQARLELPPVDFAPGRLQPAALAPVLADRLADVEGRMAMDGTLRWGAGAGVGADLDLLVENLAFTSGPARFERVNGVIALDRLVPLSTPPGQQLAVGLIDIGLPLTNGLLTFDLEPDHLAVEQLRWQFAEGRIQAAPFTIGSADMRFSTTLTAERLKLDEIFALTQLDGLSGEGTMHGTLPITVAGADAVIAGGELVSDRPGWVRYRPGQAPAALQAGGENINLLLQALENFRYEKLRLTIDGRTDAEMDVGLHIAGANPDLYDGYPIEFNLNLEGALANVLRSGLAGYQIPERIRERMQGFGR
jgi:Dicarboxylate transport